MNTESLLYAVLAGIDDVRGVYAARALARHKVPTIGLLRSRSSAGRWTRCCERFEYANTDTDDAIGALLRIGESLDDNAVLIPCIDSTVMLISRHRNELEPYYHLSLPDAGVAETMLDKLRFHEYALENGFQVPTTLSLSTEDDVAEVGSQLEFPCIVKPPTSKHPTWQRRTRLKAFIAESANHLGELFKEYASTASGPLVAQQWIPGSDANLYVTHVCFSKEAEPLVSFTSRKIQQWPPATGDVSAALEVRNDEVRDTALELFRSVAYSGIGYVEMKQHAGTGLHYIIEPNLRLSGRAGVAEAGGVALLATMYSDGAGLPLPSNRQQQYLGVKWVYLRKDLQSAAHPMRRGELTFTAWLRSIKGKKRFAMWSWRDPGPFFGDLIRSLRLIVSRRGRQMRRFHRVAPDVTAPSEERP